MAVYAAVAPLLFACAHWSLIVFDVDGSGEASVLMKLSMSPVRSHFTMPLGRSEGWTATLEAVAPGDEGDEPPHATTRNSARRAPIDVLAIDVQATNAAADGSEEDRLPARAQRVD